MSHEDILALARKNKAAISLKPDVIRKDLEALTNRYKETAPFVRDQKAFNERTYKML